MNGNQLVTGGDLPYSGPSECPGDSTFKVSDPLGFCHSNPTSWTSTGHQTQHVDNLLVAGTITLSFTVWNTGGGAAGDLGGHATGLDAQVAVDYRPPGNVAPTPEPPTVFTFASALAVGLAFWRLRLGRQTAS